MNSNRSSRAFVLGVAVVALLVAAVAPAAAAVPSVDGDAPPTKQVGTTVDETYTLTNLFDEYNEWTLSGETDLSQVTWTVTVFDNAGQQIAQRTYNNQSFAHSLRASSGAVKVTVRLQATVPEVPQSMWSYQPPQQYTVAAFAQTQRGGASTTLNSYETRPYTEKSQQARTQIDQAQQTVEDAGGVSSAQASLDNAISAYNNANFDLAIELANEAEQKAESAMQSSQTTQLIIYAVVGLVVIALVAGGVVYYLRNRETRDKLA